MCVSKHPHPHTDYFGRTRTHSDKPFSRPDDHFWHSEFGDNCGFRVEPEAPFEIAANSTAELRVTVIPVKPCKPFSGDITLFIGDPHLQKFVFTLTGLAK